MTRSKFLPKFSPNKHRRKIRLHSICDNVKVRMNPRVTSRITSFHFSLNSLSWSGSQCFNSVSSDSHPLHLLFSCISKASGHPFPSII